MSRKDYIKFADMFNDLYTSADGNKARYSISQAISETASIFASDNSNFDRYRFYDACGLKN